MEIFYFCVYSCIKVCNVLFKPLDGGPEGEFDWFRLESHSTSPLLQCVCFKPFANNHGI